MLLIGLPAFAAPKETKQLTAEEVFTALRPPLMELLSPSVRNDMLDYYHADSTYYAVNSMGGTSHIENLTPDYMKVYMTPVSSMELKVLPLKKGSDIAVVAYTVNSTGKQADTELFFFDADMNPIQAKKVFKEPDVKDFIKREKGMKTSMKELLDMVKFPTIEYTLSPDNMRLIARLTVGEYLDVDDYHILSLFLLPQLEWVWDGSKFQLIKQ